MVECCRNLSNIFQQWIGKAIINIVLRWLVLVFKLSPAVFSIAASSSPFIFIQTILQIIKMSRFDCLLNDIQLQLLLGSFASIYCDWLECPGQTNTTFQRTALNVPVRWNVVFVCPLFKSCSMLLDAARCYSVLLGAARCCSVLLGAARWSSTLFMAIKNVGWIIKITHA